MLITVMTQDGTNQFTDNIVFDDAELSKLRYPKTLIVAKVLVAVAETRRRAGLEELKDWKE